MMDETIAAFDILVFERSKSTNALTFKGDKILTPSEIGKTCRKSRNKPLDGLRPFHIHPI